MLIAIKIPMTFLTEIEKSILKLVLIHKKTSQSQSNPEQKSSTEGITLPDFKAHYRAILTEKEAWDLHKNRHENQWNIIEGPKVNPHS
jgi:hypothetical protein